MSCPINPEHIQAFKSFIQACTDQPRILNLPQLDFFKQFLESLGGKVPAGEFHFPKTSTASSKSETKTTSSGTAPKPSESESAGHESDSESDIELDKEGCVPPDTDEPHEMGDAERTVSDEDIDGASEFRSQAAQAYSNQEFEKAIGLYTDAIKLYPTNALFFAKRGQVFLKLNRPNACIRDCNRALEINCDSAAAYKYRGRANRLLGNWAEAAKDLRQACKIDFDEETDEWLREVTPNAKKIEQHNVKQDRKKKERELKDKQERNRRAQEANRKAAEENQTRFDANASASAGFGGPGFGAGFGGPGFGGPGGPTFGGPGGPAFGGAGGPGFGGAGVPGFGGPGAAGFGGPGADFGEGAGGAPGGEGGIPVGDFFSKMGLGELMGDFNDPEVYAAMMDITSNPANIAKYNNNPKIMRLINKFKNAAGKMPGSRGNFDAGNADTGFGGIPGFGGFTTSSDSPTPPPTTETPKPPKTKLQDEDLD